MSDSTWSDRELADGLEGLLDPDVAEALQAEVACDADLAARHSALAEILRPPVQLPLLPVPGGLLATTTERLAALPLDAELAAALEGEVDEATLARDPARARALRAVLAEGGEEDLPQLATPPGLLGRVLAHLEGEGLLSPADSSGAHTDQDLAALLEGVLPPAEAALLERDLGRDAELRARLELLEGVLSDAEGLPPLSLPASLGDAIGERLLDEGLVRQDLPEGANLPIRPPSDLLSRTLGRLEAAALVEPQVQPEPQPEPQEVASQGLLLTFPRALLAAAALLLLGLGLGYSVTSPAPVGDVSLEIAMAQDEADLARKELSEVTGQLGAAREALRLSREEAQGERERRASEGRDLQAARAQAAAAQADLKALEGRLAGRSQADQELAESLELARAELATNKALLARREGALEELRSSLASSRTSLATAQTQLRQAERALGESQAARQESETQRALAQSQVERLSKSVSAGMKVANAAQIQRWDADRQTWRAVSPQETLPPGALVRGVSARSTLQVSGLLPYQLRSGVYVIRDGQRLIPLPEDLHGHGSAEPAPDDVLAWIERLQSPSALQQSEASQALRAQFYALGGEGQPPTTSAGWTRWWSQARRVASR
jgi:hypothetical protein